MSPAVRVSKQVLVLGATSEAHRASRELAQLGYSVDWVLVGGTIVPDDLPSNVSVHSDCTLVGFAGEAGAFSATLRRDGKHHDLSPSAVIVATGNERYYPGERFGLALSDRVTTVSQLLSRLDMPQKSPANPPSPATILFVLDYGGQTPKETATEALTAAVCARQVWDAEVYVFYGDLKVDTPGLERLTREMRDCGILFCRYAQASLGADGNGVTVSYEEGTVQGDLLVLPEAVRPRPDTAELAALLDVRLGEDGFYQDINIRQYRPGLASRRGLFFAGRCHMDGALAEAEQDALQAVANVDALIGSGTLVAEEIIAHVDSSKCIRCLTCVRTCPHAAVEIVEQEDVTAARVMEFACYGCGACVANCPVQAIELLGESAEVSPAPAWMAARV